MSNRKIGVFDDTEVKVAEELVEEALKKRNIKRIKIIEIEQNKLNQYPMNNISELADNILANGLLEPLIGYITDDGRFRLLGGHRRHRALLFNLSRGGDDYAECITISKPPHELIEIKIIGVLNCKREMDEKAKNQIVESYRSVYEKLTPEERLINGHSIKMREWIGIQIGLSGRQVQTYLSKNKEKVEVTSTKQKKWTASGFIKVVNKNIESINSYERDELEFQNDEIRELEYSINEFECALLNMKDFYQTLKKKG